MEVWLTDHLIRAGYMSETGSTRRLRLRSCRGCGEKVANGLDDVICAFEVDADPVPLSPLGEALAMLEGRRTVAVHREGDRYVLDQRDAEHVAKRPAGSGTREDVLRLHSCGTPPPAGVLAAASTFAEVPVPPTGSEAPF